MPANAQHRSPITVNRHIHVLCHGPRLEWVTGCELLLTLMCGTCFQLPYMWLKIMCSLGICWRHICLTEGLLRSDILYLGAVYKFSHSGPQHTTGHCRPTMLAAWHTAWHYFVGWHCRAMCQGCWHCWLTLSVSKWRPTSSADNDRSCVAALRSPLATSDNYIHQVTTSANCSWLLNTFLIIRKCNYLLLFSNLPGNPYKVLPVNITDQLLKVSTNWYHLPKCTQQTGNARQRTSIWRCITGCSGGITTPVSWWLAIIRRIIVVAGIIVTRWIRSIWRAIVAAIIVIARGWITRWHCWPTFRATITSYKCMHKKYIWHSSQRFQEINAIFPNVHNSCICEWYSCCSFQPDVCVIFSICLGREFSRGEANFSWGMCSGESPGCMSGSLYKITSLCQCLAVMT